MASLLTHLGAPVRPLQALLQNQSRCAGLQAQARPRAVEGLIAGSSAVRRATADPCVPSAPGEVQPKTSDPRRVGPLEAAGKVGGGGGGGYRSGAPPPPTLGLSLPALHSGSPAHPCEGSCGSAYPPYLLISWDSHQRPSWREPSLLVPTSLQPFMFKPRKGGNQLLPQLRALLSRSGCLGGQSL